jgi:uncharacterized membrane protein
MAMDRRSLSTDFAKRPAQGLTRHLLPAGLILLGLIPALAGVARLVGLATGGSLMPDHARFSAHPLATGLHVVSAPLYCILGALQFSPALRDHATSWHRRAGRVLAPAGIAAALSGMWLTFALTPALHDSVALRLMRVGVGSAMVASIALGVIAIRARNVAAHRRWMTRAYALGIAAGTQAFVLIPQLLLGVVETDTSYAVSMAAGWLINWAVAEWAIARSAPHPALRGRAA